MRVISAILIFLWCYIIVSLKYWLKEKEEKKKKKGKRKRSKTWI